jgi:hypothetical protein
MCESSKRNFQLPLEHQGVSAGEMAIHGQGTYIASLGKLGPLRSHGKVGSRRRRLWELSDHAHCPVVGVCLPMSFVRKLVIKVHGASRHELDDYECHCTAVTESKLRTPLAELIQKELDLRCEPVIREASRIKCEADLVTWWRSKVDGPELSKVFWVMLTHPHCSDSVEYKVLGHVHMLQHQIGAVGRVEQAQLTLLAKEKEALARELLSTQNRAVQRAADASARIDSLERDVLLLRAQLMSREVEISGLNERIAQWSDQDPDLPARKELARRQTELVATNQVLRRDLLKAQESALQLEGQVQALKSRRPPVETLPTQVVQGQALADLSDRAILCVGGRPGIVPIYRELIEQEGGRFLHHDGGEENSASQLDATLAAADLVICQTGCVSHNAYWRVKEHCKRTGKRCVFVDTPSRTALSRALVDVSKALAEQEPSQT